MQEIKDDNGIGAGVKKSQSPLIGRKSFLLFPTPARRAASRIRSCPDRHSRMRFSFSSTGISICFPISFAPLPFFTVYFIGSISFCPEDGSRQGVVLLRCRPPACPHETAEEPITRRGSFTYDVDNNGTRKNAERRYWRGEHADPAQSGRCGFPNFNLCSKNYQLQILSLDRSESHCSVSSQTAV